MEKQTLDFCLNLLDYLIKKKKKKKVRSAAYSLFLLGIKVLNSKW